MMKEDIKTKHTKPKRLMILVSSGSVKAWFTYGTQNVKI